VGIGRASLTGTYECSNAAFGSRMIAIADGGIRGSGDMYKALTFGAGAVMVGGMIAGCAECPGEVSRDETGSPVMVYRGMGSKEAAVGVEDVRGYGAHSEGIVKTLPYRGGLREHLLPMIDALRHAFEVGNFRSIAELQEGVRSGEYRFGRRTPASLAESRPHS
jgi:IMP dehydrogenase